MFNDLVKENEKKKKKKKKKKQKKKKKKKKSSHRLADFQREGTCMYNMYQSFCDYSLIGSTDQATDQDKLLDI